MRVAIYIFYSYAKDAAGNNVGVEEAGCCCSSLLLRLLHGSPARIMPTPSTSILATLTARYLTTHRLDFKMPHIKSGRRDAFYDSTEFWLDPSTFSQIHRGKSTAVRP